MIAITGAAGQVGTAVSQLLPNATNLTRSELDLTKPNTIGQTLDALGCNVLINCAAYTAVDAAETDEETARLVNSSSVEAMAAWASRRKARFVTYSTDYVFDGESESPYDENSEPNPQTAYGRTKLEGELAAMHHNPKTLILRTSWVISSTHRNFVSTMIELARKGPVSVVADQIGSPTIASDLAAFTLGAMTEDVSGIIHTSNSGFASWYGLAQAAVELANLDPEMITPCTTADFPRPAKRPANSRLVSVRNLATPALPAWSDSLPDVVEGLLSDVI